MKKNKKYEKEPGPTRGGGSKGDGRHNKDTLSPGERALRRAEDKALNPGKEGVGDWIYESESTIRKD